MKLGVTMFATDYAIRPDDLARECEARGFESLWFPEHTHIPASRKSPWPGGGELPKDYWQSVTVTSSRNQPGKVTEQSVIEVKAMNTDFPAQPVVRPVAALQAASRSTVVVTKVDWVPVKIGVPAEPAGGQSAATVPL